MNSKILLLGAVVTAFAATTFASNALLSPRAQDNQPKTAATAPAAVITVAYLDAATPLSPRLRTVQTRVVKGMVETRTPVQECAQHMQGTPRAITACSQSVTMPGCMKLASSK
jgi:hypothetical protein